LVHVDVIFAGVVIELMHFKFPDDLCQVNDDIVERTITARKMRYLERKRYLKDSRIETSPERALQAFDSERVIINRVIEDIFVHPTQ